MISLHASNSYKACMYEKFLKIKYGHRDTSFFSVNSSHLGSTDEQFDLFSIRKHFDKILYCLENYKVLIVCVDTSGDNNTAQISQCLHDHGWHLRGLIGVVETHQLSTRSLTDGSELEADIIDIEFRHAEETRQAADIKHMSEEQLLLEILDDPLLTRYSVVIVNRAYETNTMTNIVHGLLKKIVRKRDALRVVVLTDAINGEALRNHYNFTEKPSGVKQSSVILSASSRPTPIQIIYKTESCCSYVEGVVETVWALHNKEPAGDVIAFLTGHDEVLEAFDLLKTQITANNLSDIRLISVLEAFNYNEHVARHVSLPKRVRRVYLAASITHTPFPIVGISYVVDCGFIQLRWYNTMSFCENFVVAPVSKDVACQRAAFVEKGRAGKVYRLYSEENYDTLPRHLQPERQHQDLCFTVLFLKAVGVDNILRFDFPSPPPAKNLLRAIEVLHALGTIASTGEITKPLGYKLAELPLHPMLGKMLYTSGMLGCSDEILSLIAMLQVRNVFTRPPTGAAQIRARVAKRNFEVAEGDLLTLLNVYTSFVQSGRSKDFCKRYFLSYGHLRRAFDLRVQLAKEAVKSLGIPLMSCRGDIDLLGRCITAGFFPNAAYLHNATTYKTIREGLELHLHPSSSLYSLPRPDFVIFGEIFQTTKLFMKNVTVIKDEWLTEFASHYYNKVNL